MAYQWRINGVSLAHRRCIVCASVAHKRRFIRVWRDLHHIGGIFLTRLAPRFRPDLLRPFDICLGPKLPRG